MDVAVRCPLEQGPEFGSLALATSRAFGTCLHRAGCDRARVGLDRLRTSAGAELTRFSHAVRQAMSFLSCLRSRSSESSRAFVAASCFFSAAMCRGGISDACAMVLLLARSGPLRIDLPATAFDAESANDTRGTSMAASDCCPGGCAPGAIRVNVRLIGATVPASETNRGHRQARDAAGRPSRQESGAVSLKRL